MPDRRFVLAGLALVLLVVSYPSWRAVAFGTRSSPPQLAKSRGTAACVWPAPQMSAAHMTLLAEWRDLVVRQGVRTVTMPDGRKWNVSLSGTCLDCHDKPKFCDRCHEYAGVTPECWSCHVVPGARPGPEGPGHTAGLKTRPTTTGAGLKTRPVSGGVS